MKNSIRQLICTRTTWRFLAIGLSLGLFQAPDASAHQVIVHEYITRHAVLSAKAGSKNYQNLLKVMTPAGSESFTFNGDPKSAMGWVIEGSAREDDEPGMVANTGGNRSYNHFNDPLSGQGLSNFPDDQKLAPYGHNSFTWAAFRNGPGLDFHHRLSKVSNVNTRNQWSWQDAREYQRLALTDSSLSIRNENAAKMFRALGHVIHLLQDTTQPQHVRDEQHLDKWFSSWKSPIEVYGGKNFQVHNYAHSVLDWKVAGFKKLRDFWDRDFFLWNRNTPTLRSAQALIDNENPNEPAKTLGLAEFVNGNFIADRHNYRELQPLLSPYHYPFPSLYEGTDWQQLFANPAAFKKVTGIGSIGWGYRYNVAKIAQGRAVSHHGAVSYLMAVHPEVAADVPPGVYSATVDDPDVLKTYHDILIPEAIRYSAGVLDYFSRGRVETRHAWNGFQYHLKIINRSGESLQGGQFKLFRDEVSGARVEIATVANSGTLADGEFVEATFSDPLTLPSPHTVVYQGTVGIAAGNPLDPVDANVAIITKRFVIEPMPCDYQLWELAAAGTLRLRIKDYDAQWFPLPCADCNIPNTSKPEWDGTFAFRQDQFVPDGAKYAWHSDPDASFPPDESSFRLKTIKMAVALITTIPHAESRSGCAYQILISCWRTNPATNEEESKTVWRGRKIDGATALGEYKLDQTDLCNFADLPTEFEIEAY